MGEFAWQAKVDVSNRSLNCNDCLDARAEFSAGWSGYEQDWVPFVLLGAQLRTTAHQASFLAAVVHMGVFRMWSNNQSSYMTMIHNNGFQGELNRNTTLRIHHRYQLTRVRDIRFHLASDRYGSEAGLGFSWYW